MTDAGSPMVRLAGVELTLTGGSGPVPVLRGVDLEVAASETVSVIGPSGSGKTTLLMVMAGLERPTAGTVTVAGHDYASLDEDGLARFRRGNVGVVFQAFHLVPTMTALENVALPLEFAGAADARGRAAQGLEAVGLGSRAGHYPAQLSGGEQQRVAIARAFAPRPRLLLADEPTGNLDEDTGRRVADLLFSLREDFGATLVLVTHDMALAGRCSRSVAMHGGCIDDCIGGGMGGAGSPA